MTFDPRVSPLLEKWDASERVLVLSDSPDNAEYVARILREGGREGVVAVAPAQLAEHFARFEPAAVIIDSLDPLPFIIQSHDLDGSAALLLLTGGIDGPRVAQLFRAGAADVVTLPHTAERLRDALTTVLKDRRERVRKEHYTSWLRNLLTELRSDVERESDRVVQHSVAALEVLSQALEAKDTYMAGHSVRVAEIAACLATAMGRSEWEIERVRLAGRLHDIGMIAVPTELLSRAGPLSEPEYTVIREHPIIATQILAPFESLADVVSFIRGHHERWDGGGYPDGLGGEAIPWGARIVAVAEVFDALATSRPYQGAIPLEECLDRMRGMSGLQIDPAAYQALVTVVTTGRFLRFLHPCEDSGRGSHESWNTLSTEAEPATCA
jgi:response regulator RpfG family c-di-GMP phosphodiesterase